MNTIEIRTHIDPDSDGEGNPALMTMIFIDSEPLITDEGEHAIDIYQLDQSAQNDGHFFIRDEQEDARLWEEALARSEPKLSKLADKIRADTAAGRTKPFDPDLL